MILLYSIRNEKQKEGPPGGSPSNAVRLVFSGLNARDGFDFLEDVFEVVHDIRRNLAHLLLVVQGVEFGKGAVFLVGRFDLCVNTLEYIRGFNSNLVCVKRAPDLFGGVGGFDEDWLLDRIG